VAQPRTEARGRRMMSKFMWELFGNPLAHGPATPPGCGGGGLELAVFAVVANASLFAVVVLGVHAGGLTGFRNLISDCEQ